MRRSILRTWERSIADVIGRAHKIRELAYFPNSIANGIALNRPMVGSPAAHTFLTPCTIDLWIFDSFSSPIALSLTCRLSLYLPSRPYRHCPYLQSRPYRLPVTFRRVLTLRRVFTNYSIATHPVKNWRARRYGYIRICGWVVMPSRGT